MIARDAWRRVECARIAAAEGAPADATPAEVAALIAHAPSAVAFLEEAGLLPFAAQWCLQPVGRGGWRARYDFALDDGEGADPGRLFAASLADLAKDGNLAHALPAGFLRACGGAHGPLAWLLALSRHDARVRAGEPRDCSCALFGVEARDLLERAAHAARTARGRRAQIVRRGASDPGARLVRWISETTGEACASRIARDLLAIADEPAHPSRTIAQRFTCNARTGEPLTPADVARKVARLLPHAAKQERKA